MTVFINQCDQVFLCYTKYKSSLIYKAVYNHIMPYLIVLMITDLEIFEDPKNKQINLWPERNYMALNKMTLNT